MSNVANAFMALFEATNNLGSALEGLASKEDVNVRILDIQQSVQHLEDRAVHIEDVVRNMDTKAFIEISEDLQSQMSGLETLVNSLEDSIMGDVQSQIDDLKASVSSLEDSIKSLEDEEDSDDSFVRMYEFKELDGVVSDLWNKFDNIIYSSEYEASENLRERLDIVEKSLGDTISEVSSLLDIKDRVDQLSAQMCSTTDADIEALKQAITARDAQIEALTLMYNHQSTQIASLTAQVNVLFQAVSSFCKSADK